MDKIIEGARNDAVRYAREVASRYSVADNVSVMVYEREGVFFVLPNKFNEGFGAAPNDARVYCIAQRWSSEEVQVRYSGGWSDWSSTK